VIAPTWRTHAARPDADVTPARVLPPRLRDPRAERDADAFAGGTLRRPPSSGAATTRPPASQRGEMLPPLVRAWAEPRLGIDLGDVRVHDDAEAHALAADRRARALAAGMDVLFARGEYRPETPGGRELLLHELAHVAQQREAGDARTQYQEMQDPPATGIGRTPPEADYAVGRIAAPDDEDLNVLFTRDHVDVAASLADRVRVVLASHTGAVVVRIHGYASGEGDERYDLNLSAHRVVAVRDAISALLPAGSAVHLIAHGETLAFGDDPAANRRVGIGVSDMPAQPSVEEDAQRWLRRHPNPLGGELRLEVDPTLTPPLTAPQVVVQAPAISRPGLLDWEIGDPNTLLARSGPQPAPVLTPAAAASVVPGIPWSLFAQDFRLRQLPFGEAEQTFVTRHWQTWYPLAVFAYGVTSHAPWPISKAFDSPNDVMTTLTRKMISSSLSGERPDAVELFDLELKRIGVPTPIYGFLTWQFDPDFRRWEKPHIR
jgi:outer membrane protein OmpA-like peptidoglycan-associated protein